MTDSSSTNEFRKVIEHNYILLCPLRVYLCNPTALSSFPAFAMKSAVCAQPAWDPKTWKKSVCTFSTFRGVRFASQKKNKKKMFSHTAHHTREDLPASA